MKHRIHAAHGRAHGGRVEQVKPGAPRGLYVMPGSLSDRPESTAESTCSSSDEHPHEISFPGWPQMSSRSWANPP
jgi:hypothetical protein